MGTEAMTLPDGQVVQPQTVGAGAVRRLSATVPKCSWSGEAQNPSDLVVEQGVVR